MSKEIGPRERALREMREARFGKSQATVDPPKVAVLREKVAKIKPKAKKGKRK